MSRFSLPLALAMALATAPALGQPLGDADQATRSVSPYLYLMDGSGNKLLLTTQFWRNDAKYDDRAFHRFLDVLAAVEKRGFHKNEKAAIDNWDKPQPYARCYIYLEDLQAGRKTKTAVTSGTRVWCTDNGASEMEIDKSDAPKHVDLVLQHFDTYLNRAKKNLHK